ncbi:MAG: DUF502 domain-containing protein [Bacillota bacterium]
MSLKRFFTTGLLTLLPLGITIYIFYLIFNFLDTLLGRVINRFYNFQVPGIGFAAGIVLIFLVGFIASNFIGRKIIGFWDTVFQRLPLTRSIYSSAKQIIDAFTVQGKHAFQKVVLLEYPRKGLYVLGFITGSSRGEVQEKTNETVINVFVPTTPNPTSGMLVLAPSHEVIELEMTIEEGMKVIISGGLVSPPGRNETAALNPAPPA